MKYEKLVDEILENVGGKDNIAFATHCITRLRLTPKDKGLINDEVIRSLNGVIGTKFAGNQYQIIIGNEVGEVYKKFCEKTGFAQNDVVEEKLDLKETKEKLTVKSVVDSVLEVVSGCVAPMLPIITAAGLLKMIVAVLGPTMLNVVPADSDLMVLFTFVGDAGFYFFPVYAAYVSAKRFNTNIPMALFLAGVLLHPTLNQIVASGEAFSVYGIPMTLTTYSSNFISAILITWIMSYVEKGLNKVIPKEIRAFLHPLCLTVIMLPIALCILGPLGAIVGNGIANAFVVLNKVLGPFATAIIGALWPFLIATGMHQGIIAIAFGTIAEIGYDANILVGAFVGVYGFIGLALAYFLKTKDTDEKSMAASALLMQVVGGVGEPVLFGIVLKHKKAMIYTLISGFFGGLCAGILKAVVFFGGNANVLTILGFGETIVQGTIACVLTGIIAFVLGMVFGFGDSKAA